VTGLPFSRDQFLDVFAAYNAAVWPVAAALWLATLAAGVGLLRRRAGGTGLAALLAVLWAWAGLVYHAGFFAAINPAAWLFAALFAVQAGAFAWHGVVRRRLAFDWRGSRRHGLALALLACALAYPGVALVTGHDWPRTPTYGVPCPTALFTAGLLLAAAPPVPRGLLVIPVLWSLVGGSAALVLGVLPDLALFAAAAALGARAATPALLDGPGAR
jgi:hypothetical protein